MEEQSINQEDVNQEDSADAVNEPSVVEAKQEAGDSVEQSEGSSSGQNTTETQSVSEEKPVEEAKLESSSEEVSSEQNNTEQSNSEQGNLEQSETDQKADSEEKSKQGDVNQDNASQDGETEEAEEELGLGGLKKLSDEKEKLPWFVVHTYSGSEAKVKIALLDRIRNAKAEDLFGHIVVPEENVTEMVKGEKKTSKKKFFPGYIMVQCKLDEHAWHLVTGTPKVTGFVGDNVNPSPLSPEEVGTLLQQIEGNGPKSRVSIEFEQGDTVKVVDGPFSDFNGTVDDVKPEKGKLRVLISIFGRNTPVELDFFQVEKV